MNDRSIRLRAILRNPYTFPEPQETYYQDSLRARSCGQGRPMMFRPKGVPTPFTEFTITKCGTQHSVWRQIPEPLITFPEWYQCSHSPRFFFFFELDGGGTGPARIDGLTLSLYSKEGSDVVASIEVGNSWVLGQNALNRPLGLSFLLYSVLNLPDIGHNRRLRQLPLSGDCESIEEDANIA
jgi:hypothetical protein